LKRTSKKVIIVYGNWEEIMEAIGKVNDIHLLMNEPMQGKGQQIPM
jgi:hypothetical protein